MAAPPFRLWSRRSRVRGIRNGQGDGVQFEIRKRLLHRLRFRIRLGGTAGPADSKFPQNHFQRTKIRKRGLYQIEAHEGRKPKPIRVVVMGQ